MQGDVGSGSCTMRKSGVECITRCLAETLREDTSVMVMNTTVYMCLLISSCR